MFGRECFEFRSVVLADNAAVKKKEFIHTGKTKQDCYENWCHPSLLLMGPATAHSILRDLPHQTQPTSSNLRRSGTLWGALVTALSVVSWARTLHHGSHDGERWLQAAPSNRELRCTVD